jgi:hypothetical protein
MEPTFGPISQVLRRAFGIRPIGFSPPLDQIDVDARRGHIVLAQPAKRSTRKGK